MLQILDTTLLALLVFLFCIQNFTSLYFFRNDELRASILFLLQFLSFVRDSFSFKKHCTFAKRNLQAMWYTCMRYRRSPFKVRYHFVCSPSFGLHNFVALMLRTHISFHPSQKDIIVSVGAHKWEDPTSLFVNVLHIYWYVTHSRVLKNKYHTRFSLPGNYI